MKVVKVLVIVLIIGLVLCGIGYFAVGGKDGIVKLFGPAERIEATIVEEQVVTSLSLNVSSDDVVFHKAEDNKLKITYFDDKNSPFTYSFNEGKASLSEQSIKDKNWIDALRIQKQVEDYSVHVYLPESCTDTITVYLSSGELTLENWMCNSFEFAMSSGKINVNNFNANSIKGQLTSGECNLSKSTVGNVSVTASSGDISLSNITADDITAVTTSGSIAIDFTTAVNVTINTSGGGTTCNRLRAEFLKSISTSGQQTLVMLGTPEEYRIDAKVSSGEIFISKGTDKLAQTEDDIIYGNGSRTMDISASSGGININFVGE